MNRIINHFKKNPIVYIAIVVVIIYAYMKFFRTEGMQDQADTEQAAQLGSMIHSRDLAAAQVENIAKDIEVQRMRIKRLGPPATLTKADQMKLKRASNKIDKLTVTLKDVQGDVDTKVKKIKQLEQEGLRKVSVSESGNNHLNITYGGMALNCTLEGQSATCRWGDNRNRDAPTPAIKKLDSRTAIPAIKKLDSRTAIPAIKKLDSRTAIPAGAAPSAGPLIKVSQPAYALENIN